MIEFISNSVFDSKCDMLVNTINCKGVMGAGIALEFSLRYPEMYELYKKDCIAGTVLIGETKVYECDGKKILNFPTKEDPFKKSEIDYIVRGLDYFIKNYSKFNIKSVAFPLLGCMNGQLDFERDVKSLMLQYLSIPQDLNIKICMNQDGPQGLELQMLNIIKNINISKLIEELGLDIDVKQLSISIQSIHRFYDLACSKHLKNEDMYRKIWLYIRNKI